ncbi:MAG: DEAD/DEAH box helicase, partial [Treponema sp.]|nr:DEAD/DEAH box helicase [Treponema sp.]
MLLRSIAVPLTAISGIGPALVQKLARLDIRNVAGLLCHYPRDWEDRRITVPIKEFQHKQICTEVTVIARDWFGFGRMRTLKVYVEDDSGRAALLCFNRPWLEKQLVQGERYRLWGRFYYKYGEIQSSSFEIESIAESAGEGNILPVYPLSAGLTQAILRRYIERAIEQYAAKLENELPAEIIEKNHFLPKAAAIKAIHFPASLEELQLAKKTLIYEELFYLEIVVGKRAVERKKGSGEWGMGNGEQRAVISEQGTENEATFAIHSPPTPSPLQQRLLERLPFSLTKGQMEAIAAINADMTRNGYSMARLLQGDVGSGKTLVSFLAALQAAEAPSKEGGGGQTAIMAPTELLARQHAENAARLLEPIGLRIAYLTGNIKAAGRKDLLKHL